MLRSLSSRLLARSYVSSACRCTPYSSVISIHRHIARPRSQIPLSAPFPNRHFSTNGPRLRAKYTRFNYDSEHPVDVNKWDTPTKVVVALSVGGGVYFVTHLEQVPETGRWRFMDINPKYEAKLAKASYEEVLAVFKGKILPENHPITRHVRRVVTRILESSNLGTLAGAEPRYIAAAGASEDLWNPHVQSPEDVPPGVGGREWNLIVVNDDKVVNAMAAYGNIVVFTGILPLAKDEQGLAAVLGHEIGHVVLRHNSERYSSMKIVIGIAYFMEIIGLDFLGFTRLLTWLLYDLPNSRTQELEGQGISLRISVARSDRKSGSAFRCYSFTFFKSHGTDTDTNGVADQVGLKLTAKACFDPHAAPEMFTRLGQLEKHMGGLKLAFIDTHPPSEKRVKRLEELLPDAYAIQAASSECSGELQNSISAFKDTFAHGPWRGASDGVTWT